MKENREEGKQTDTKNVTHSDSYLRPEQLEKRYPFVGWNRRKKFIEIKSNAMTTKGWNDCMADKAVDGGVIGKFIQLTHKYTR
jgi:hypothetical protein